MLVFCTSVAQLPRCCSQGDCFDLCSYWVCVFQALPAWRWHVSCYYTDSETVHQCRHGNCCSPRPARTSGAVPSRGLADTHSPRNPHTQPNEWMWSRRVLHMRLLLQIVDLVSTWRSVGPELSLDSRPLMVKGIAELLALVPQLAVNSEEYEVSHLLHEIFCLRFLPVCFQPWLPLVILSCKTVREPLLPKQF